MKNHEDNFDELHMENMENTDARLADAYNSAIAVPDMWDRISAGFDTELENIKNEKLSQGKVKVNTDERYGRTDVSGDNRKHKKTAHYKSWMGLAAAVLLICVIAIPLISSGIMRNKKTETMDMTMADDSYGMEYGEVQSAAEENSDDVAESAAESYDDVTESAEESYDAETNKAAGAYDSNAFEPESENADSAALDITSAGEHTEDGTPADFEVEVSGSITRSGDEYILTVTAVLSTTESDYNISENDKFKLIAAGDKTNLKDGETVSYENIRLDNLKPITENDAANTGHEISYTAEVVMVE